MRLLPHVSEKAYDGTKKRTYAFQVPRDADKFAIKREVEATYGVAVTGVRTLSQKPKTRRRGRRGGGSITGEKSGFKKAYVTLKEGDTIKELNS